VINPGGNGASQHRSGLGAAVIGVKKEGGYVGHFPMSDVASKDKEGRQRRSRSNLICAAFYLKTGGLRTSIFRGVTAEIWSGSFCGDWVSKISLIFV